MPKLGMGILTHVFHEIVLFNANIALSERFTTKKYGTSGPPFVLQDWCNLVRALAATLSK